MRPSRSMSGQVEIRPYRPEDRNDLFGAVRESLEQIAPWMPWCHPDYSIEDANLWIETTLRASETGTMYDFAILSNDRIAGGCGINHINTQDRVANLGYWIRTSCTGQGIASFAVKLLIAWAFANTNLNRIEIVVAVGNHKSQRVAERVGARKDAILPMRTMANGCPSDAIMNSVLRPDHA